MMALDNTPDGWIVLRVTVYRKGDKLMLTGEPSEVEDAHNCDQMACGMDHVVIRATVDVADKAGGLMEVNCPEETAS